MLDSLQEAPSLPPLTSTEVQVWRIDLTDALPSEEELLKSLSDEEADRAARLRKGETRMQFLAGRAGLRILLGAALDIAPKSIHIETGNYGKPEVAPVKDRQVHFNVAHSGATVLIAMTLAGPVGIDVEYLDRKTDVFGVARHAFTTGEIECLLNLGEPGEQVSYFFKFWTRKEAVIKADGRGLSLPLTQIKIPIDAEVYLSPTSLIGGGDYPERQYFVSDITLGEGIACAIAVTDRQAIRRLFEFPPTAFAPLK
jgi:4'-phosphopantetheinyl transferase